MSWAAKPSYSLCAKAEVKQGAMLAVLWLALNHPHHAELMRRGVSTALREKGYAHISVMADRRRSWSFALAERWVDMTALLAAVPPDAEISLGHESGADAPPLR